MKEMLKSLKKHKDFNLLEESVFIANDLEGCNYNFQRKENCFKIIFGKRNYDFIDALYDANLDIYMIDRNYSKYFLKSVRENNKNYVVKSKFTIGGYTYIQF
jgi:hypothetical protein